MVYSLCLTYENSELGGKVLFELKGEGWVGLTQQMVERVSFVSRQMSRTGRRPIWLAWRVSRRANIMLEKQDSGGGGGGCHGVHTTDIWRVSHQG